ncbi:MAG: AAA family ATPase [Bacteroides sp.]|nr:AAA family ATPase [Bacteroides sp.]
MKQIDNPLSLSLLQVSVYGADSVIAKSYLGVELFDNRHDFIVGSNQSGVAVLMMFTNERALVTPTEGVSHNVAVSLIDMTGKYLITSTVIEVNMGRYDEMTNIRVDLPLKYADINPDHTYKVTVRDECSHRLLGEHVVHVFDENRCGKHVTDWFEVILAGMSPEYTHSLYKALYADTMNYYTVRFNLRPTFNEEPFIMPEMEIRIHYPNGEVDSRFCTPECDDLYTNQYHVEIPFLIRKTNLGICYAELICMDYALAGIVFCTCADTIIGPWEGKGLECLDEYSLSAAAERYNMLLAAEKADSTDDDYESLTNEEFDHLLEEMIATQQEPEEEPDDPEEPIPEVAEATERNFMEALDRLTGLMSVKEKLSAYEKLMRFNKMRADTGLPVSAFPLHAMFLGSPGTGKTTVAKLMGKMLHEAGVLSKGHVVVRERATLLGPNYSMEESNTLAAIEEAQGGILLIDEAYQLYQPKDPRDPGKFVIETLMSSLADESKRDWMLILAGYPDEMKRMFEMNPGLRSRIPDSNVYIFEDFSEAELMDIAERFLEEYGYHLLPEAAEALRIRLALDCSRRDKNFGNARHVINMIQTEILPAMAIRVMAKEDISYNALSVILPEDIPSTKRNLRSTTTPRIGYSVIN